MPSGRQCCCPSLLSCSARTDGGSNTACCPQDPLLCCSSRHCWFLETFAPFFHWQSHSFPLVRGSFWPQVLQGFDKAVAPTLIYTQCPSSKAGGRAVLMGCLPPAISRQFSSPCSGNTRLSKQDRLADLPQPTSASCRQPQSLPDSSSSLQTLPNFNSDYCKHTHTLHQHSLSSFSRNMALP